MGNPIDTLSEKYFSGAPLYVEFVRVEQCECIHIHWRDLRILMTVEQFKRFFETLKDAYKIWDKELSPEKDVLLISSNIPESPLFEGRGLIEEQHGELIHFHYADLRLELQPQTFLMMTRLFEQAKRKYNQKRVRYLPVKDIDPYDPGHFDNKEQWKEYDEKHPEREDNYEYHQIGIRFVQEKLGLSFFCDKMRPISVIKIGENKYKRLDGFKRYMAWKNTFGEDSKIPCYIEEGEVTPGNQDGQSWFLE